MVCSLPWSPSLLAVPLLTTGEPVLSDVSILLCNPCISIVVENIISLSCLYFVVFAVLFYHGGCWLEYKFKINDTARVVPVHGVW